MLFIYLPEKVIAISKKVLAEIAQLGERQTEDLKVPGSIPGLGMLRHSSLCHAAVRLCKYIRCSLTGPRCVQTTRETHIYGPKRMRPL